MPRDRRHSGDVEVRAAVAAQELRFEQRPHVEVRFPGTGTRDSGQQTTRQNVDSPVQTGKTYRRVYVATRIWDRLIDDDVDQGR